ncbi:uncharacterized protein [Anabrus simplex]|uniref:uncharacterized protein n=1 Tax=Anabrus simplex TaxID=316456 RepID=UPI0035A34598
MCDHNYCQRCSVTMASILLLVLASFASANQNVPAGGLYPGLLQGDFYSKAKISEYQISGYSSSENPTLIRFMLQDSATESSVETKQVPENSDSEVSEKSGVSITEGLIQSTLTPEFAVTEDVMQSTQAPEVGTTEDAIQNTQAPEVGTTEDVLQSTQASEFRMTEVEVISSQLDDDNVTLQMMHDVPLTSIRRETEADNEIANTYYEVDHKQSRDEVTNVTQDRQDSHPCVRECRVDAPAKRCYYHFELEWYSTMSKACYSCPSNKSDCEREHCVTADGIERPIIVVNRQIPGPTVEVCQGDTIIVDVQNHMMEETTSIHWHGQHQRETPYMDGVPYVTQCPITPKSKFQYQFKAENPGTHFWHSHTGCQRADGMFGALIVHKPRSEDPHAALYDFDLSEHTIQILDWGHELGIEKFLAHHHSNGTNKPVSLLVNGKGWVGGLRDIPAATFTVEQGYRYRFRLINAGFLNCPIEISVDNHTILVISSDGQDFRPVEATSLVSYAGERFDFILEANQNITNYWIRFRGLMDCDERFTSTHQVAVLHYKGASADEEPLGEVHYNNSHRDGQQVNSLNVGTGTDFSTVIPELDAIEEDDESLKPEPDMQLYISYDFYAIDNPHYHRFPHYGFKKVPDNNRKLYTPQLNHISMKLPSFPMLSERDRLTSNMFCNESTISETNCTEKYCECTHVIQVPLGHVVELILVDKGVTYDANHPFHLHGHAFRVIAMDRVGNSTTVEEVKNLDREGLIKRKLKGAPLKDTVTVPDGGYTVVRISASNPGYWLFHCHIEFHVELGMSIVFKVGEDSDMLPVPRGFPQCYNYVPDELDSEVDQIKEIENEVPFERLRQEQSSKERTVASCLLLVLILCIHL